MEKIFIIPFLAPPLLALVCPNSTDHLPHAGQEVERLEEPQTPLKRGFFFIAISQIFSFAVNYPFSVVWFAFVHRNSFLS